MPGFWRNPYPDRMSVTKADALADLQLVDDGLTEDITLLGDLERSMLMIMKDGQIGRNMLTAG